MSRLWFVADLHLGHEKVTTEFKDSEGRPLRPFASAAEMDEAIVSNWNETVHDRDQVYVLGDVCIKPENLETLHRLNGTLILVGGNHDTASAWKYLDYFADVRGSYERKNILFTHIPIHPTECNRWRGNVHGHLHSRRVLLPDGTIDPRYMCVSLEQTNFRPMSWDDIRNRLPKFSIRHEQRLNSSGAGEDPG